MNCRGKLVDLSTPIVMGIINITPDSFYENSRFPTPELVLQQATKHVNEGATILDLGAYSSRPGAQHISQTEELERLTPALKIIRKNFPDVIISVDTFRSEIARIVVESFEVDIINDILAGEYDANMFKTIARLNTPYIIMHCKGMPQNMQNNPTYNDILKEIIFYFSEKIRELNQMGVNDIIIDPGFGFGKTIEHNYTLLNQLNDFKILDLPVLVGLSRKSMIYKLLNIKPEDALNGTMVLQTIALQKGAKILRVHDVKPAIEAIKLLKFTNNLH